MFSKEKLQAEHEKVQQILDSNLLGAATKYRNPVKIPTKNYESKVKAESVVA